MSEPLLFSFIAIGLALVILMLYALYWKRYDRCVWLFLLAWADTQLAQAVTAYSRGHSALMWMYVISAIAMPVFLFAWMRRVVKRR